MSEKGISEIIATILMLMITIGLAGTAFIYISSFLQSRTQKGINLIDISCSNSTAAVYITIKNTDPNLAIDSGELTVMYDGSPQSVSWNPSPIQPQKNSVGRITCSGSMCVKGSLHTVKVIGPSNSVEGSTAC
jgi:flagellin-like protein